MQQLLPLWRNTLAATLGFGLFAMAFLYTGDMLTARSGSGGELVKRPRAGTEVVAVFVVSSTCGAVEYPGLDDALDDIRRTLRANAAREDKAFASIGVSLDDDPWRGTELLRRFGPFDEILSGGNWLNTGSIVFVLRDFPSRRAIPQLVLVEREVAMNTDGITSVEDRLIGRKIGSESIVSFAQSLLAASRDAQARQP